MIKMHTVTFAEKIAELRIQHGLSQKELGDILGVSNKAVSKWENGESMPKTTTMLKIAEHFEIDVNELMGFSSNISNDEQSKDELDRLKSENVILSSKLNEIDKRKKRAFVTVALICAIGIVASIIIAFCTNADEKINSEIKDAGNQNTKIVFADQTFTPATEFQNYIYSNPDYDYYYYDDDTKYAKYYDKNGKEHKVTITCNAYYDFVLLNVGNKKYYYVSDNNDDNILPKNILLLDLYDKSIANDDYLGNDYCLDWNDDYKAIACFCNFYNKKGKPVDKKITKNFLGNNSRCVSIEFRDTNYHDASIELGEFFEDKDGNIYFYDYVTTNSYSVGKELSDYVYKYEKTK